MKLHQWALIFIVLTAFSFFVLFHRQDTQDRQSYQDGDLKFELTASLLDSITLCVENINSEGCIFYSEAQRELAYDTFFRTLSINLNKYATKDLYLQDYIPCIFLVDNDGYYVTYRQLDATNSWQTVTTPINVFSEYVSGGNILVRYYLDDKVKVIDRVTGETYEGNRKTVAKRLANPHTNFLLDDQEFNDRRSICIIDKLTTDVNYYVNNYNAISNFEYELEIPVDTMIGYGKTIDRPCMFSFMQGKFAGVPGQKANVYAYAQSEIIDLKLYYVSDNGYYHIYSCPDADTERGLSMKECAKMGLYPHDCVR